MHNSVPESDPGARLPRVVIVGGGFGGLFAARRLGDAPCEVTLVDRRNFHLFQPLLYQVATGGLSPADIASPLRFVLRKQKNTRVVLGAATGFDVKRKVVRLERGELPYDQLVVAAGAGKSYFGPDRWREIAPGLKTIEDATEIRRRVLGAFEEAELEDDPERRRALLTFVIVGGGPTGLELAGTIGELSRDTLPSDFRRIDTQKARIVLVEASDRLLPGMPARLSAKATASLHRFGVDVRVDTRLEELDEGHAVLQHAGEKERIDARTVLWAAGVKPSVLGRRLAEETGAELDESGRVVVRPDLSVEGHEDIFVVGDLAHFRDESGEPLPGLAPVAIQQGRHVARMLRRRWRGESTETFRYLDKGNLATIGRSAAVGYFGKLQFSGFPAWIVWLFVHLVYLVEFENRLLVFFQWFWNYMTWNRSARLITRRGLDDIKPNPDG